MQEEYLTERNCMRRANGSAGESAGEGHGEEEDADVQEDDDELSVEQGQQELDQEHQQQGVEQQRQRHLHKDKRLADGLVGGNWVVQMKKQSAIIQGGETATSSSIPFPAYIEKSAFLKKRVLWGNESSF